MAIIVTPGRLPPDGPNFKPESNLTEFVQSTQITNFGPDEFGGIELAFVFSQTEAPGSHESLSPGTLWFQRGRGVLNMWYSDFVASGSVDSAYSGQGRWLRMSDGREFLNRPVGFGNPVTRFQMRQVDNASSGDTGTRGHARQVPAFSGIGGNQVQRQSVWAGFSTGLEATYPTVQASSYRYEVLVDIGWGRLPVKDNMPGPAPAMIGTTEYTGVRTDLQDSLQTNFAFVAYVTESTASFAEQSFVDCFVFGEAPRYYL